MASTRQKIHAAVMQMTPTIMTAVMRHPTPQARAKALRMILQGVDKTLSQRVAQATLAMEQKGVPAQKAIQQAIANELALYMNDLIMGLDNAVEGMGGWGGVFDEDIPGHGLGTVTVGGQAYTPGSVAAAVQQAAGTGTGYAVGQALGRQTWYPPQPAGASMSQPTTSRAEATTGIIDTVFGQINRLAETVGNITVSGMQARRGQTVTGLPRAPEGGLIAVDEEGVTLGPGGIAGAAPWGVIIGGGLAAAGIVGIIYWAAQRKSKREQREQRKAA